jgi:hypothetical protein
MTVKKNVHSYYKSQSCKALFETPCIEAATVVDSLLCLGTIQPSIQWPSGRGEEGEEADTVLANDIVLPFYKWSSYTSD